MKALRTGLSYPGSNSSLGPTAAFRNRSFRIAHRRAARTRIIQRVFQLSWTLPDYLRGPQRLTAAQSANGGRGRIRTSVARKERQIYSLLVLATHPPVRLRTPRPYSSWRHIQNGIAVTRNEEGHQIQKGLVSRHQPVVVSSYSSRPQPLYLPEDSEFRSNFKLANLSWRRDLNPRPSDYKSDALPLSYASPVETHRI